MEHPLEPLLDQISSAGHTADDPADHLRECAIVRGRISRDETESHTVNLTSIAPPPDRSRNGRKASEDDKARVAAD